MRLAISLGDPAGIGPEVTLKALSDPSLSRAADYILVGEAKRPAGLPARRPSKASGRIAAAAVRNAAALVMAGEADALVTAPISKEALLMAGEKDPGHTELLARLAGLKPSDVGMMLVGGGLRVFLATRHVSLKTAIARLEPGMLQKAIRLCASGLQRQFSLRKPRLALAGLNPHAGENGAFGDEELRVLKPALKVFSKEKSFSISGPLPADTVFAKAVTGAYDAVICLYHDQGLIPLKLLAFDSGVNVSLGLPFVRTSPDHGTAYDIAGKGKADPGSMKAAIRLALELLKRRRARA
jgi:4-hydroxythreonine-4-phosphate dehydrogenase